MPDGTSQAGLGDLCLVDGTFDETFDGAFDGTFDETLDGALDGHSMEHSMEHSTERSMEHSVCISVLMHACVHDHAICRGSTRRLLTRARRRCTRLRHAPNAPARAHAYGKKKLTGSVRPVSGDSDTSSDSFAIDDVSPRLKKISTRNCRCPACPLRRYGHAGTQNDR